MNYGDGDTDELQHDNTQRRLLIVIQSFAL